MRTTDVRDRWVHRPAPLAEPRLRLFLLPHAGGGASSFRRWGAGLPAGVEACAVQLPGRENRMGEAAFDRIEPLVDALIEGTAAWRDRPWAVLGHSNGALLAFEWARRLRDRGDAGPVHLFASGRRAPDVPSRRAPTAHLPDDAFLDELRALNGIPREVLEHPELMALLLPTLRADVALNEAYVFRAAPPLDVPITALGGTRDEKAARADLEAWGRHTTGPFTLRLFSGDHFFLHADASDAVREAVSAALAP